MKTTDLNFSYQGQLYVGYEFSQLPLAAALVAACQQIDQAADVARRAVVGDALRAIEYQTAAGEASLFAAAGYAGEVPPSVQSWMDAAGLDAQEATDSILAEANAWESALQAVRAARLKGKQLVLKADSHDVAASLAGQAITAVHACVAGVGNAA